MGEKNQQKKSNEIKLEEILLLGDMVQQKKKIFQKYNLSQNEIKKNGNLNAQWGNFRLIF